MLRTFRGAKRSFTVKSSLPDTVFGVVTVMTPGTWVILESVAAAADRENSEHAHVSMVKTT